jgi:D-sedoheptulose 7-phosphate isomerase
MNDDAELRAAVLRKAAEGRAVQAELFDGQADAIVRCARALAAVFDRGGRLFTMGNGGSSCDAQHLAVEFMHPIFEKRPALAARALGNDVAFLTALSNDEDFSVALARELTLVARGGENRDAVVAISTSGKARNVVRALGVARDMGLLTIGLTGKDGGKMPGLCDHTFVVPSYSIHRIQESHVALMHVLWDAVHLLRGEEDIQ